MMLEILADNRDLKIQVKEAEEMITQVQIENLPSYEIGMEKGMEKGKEEGKAEGKAEGKEEGKAEGKKEGKEEERLKAEQEKLMSAKKLLNVLDDETIANSLNLALDIVKKLRAEHLNAN